jgi:hypothetical protein
LESESTDRSVLIKRIDLSHGSIQDSLIVCNAGLIPFKKPAHILINNQSCLISIVQKGGYNKNSGSVDYKIVYVIAGVNNGISVIRRDSLSDAILGTFIQYSDDPSFRLKMYRNNDTLQIFPSGDYTLDNNYRFRRLRGFDPHISPGGIRRSGPFEYLDRLNLPNTHQLYSAIADDSQYRILRLDNQQMPADSLMIESNERASDIYAYHPQRDRLYVFHLNYEAHGKFPESDRNYGDDWITPEVLIYDPNTLHLLESHQVADFDSANYPGNERGMADVVGDYIVYYFFEDDWMGRFYPAMLFIFDTRTNQATWLRVGWR